MRLYVCAYVGRLCMYLPMCVRAMCIVCYSMYVCMINIDLCIYVRCVCRLCMYVRCALLSCVCMRVWYLYVCLCHAMYVCRSVMYVCYVLYLRNVCMYVLYVCLLVCNVCM